MVKISKGTRKVIVPLSHNAEENRLRLLAGGKRLRPVWRVYAVKEHGTVAEVHDCMTFKAAGLTPMFEAKGLHAPWFKADRPLQLWMETTNEVTLYDTFDNQTSEEKGND